ncbi:MAG: tetratricopeptide repeat protein [Pseudomonadota bacterium]
MRYGLGLALLLSLTVLSTTGQSRGVVLTSTDAVELPSGSIAAANAEVVQRLASGDVEAAYRLAQGTLAVAEDTLGRYRLLTLESLENLASVHDRRGSFGEAAAFYRVALDVRQHIFGPEHPQSIGTLQDLAVILELTGQVDEATVLHQRALALGEQTFGPDHPVTLDARDRLVAHLIKVGRHDDAGSLARSSAEEHAAQALEPGLSVTKGDPVDAGPGVPLTRASLAERPLMTGLGQPPETASTDRAIRARSVDPWSVGPRPSDAATGRGMVLSRSAGVGEGASDIWASRIFTGPDQFPPDGFSAYGIIAFPRGLSPMDGERATLICEAYVHGLMTSKEVASRLNVPLDDQMATVWPVTSNEMADRLNEAPRSVLCEDAITSYDTVAGNIAIRDAEIAGLDASGRGPYLLAWSPSASKGDANATVLVADLSMLESFDAAAEAFQHWAADIEAEPNLWRKGWDLDRAISKVRNWFDHHGSRMLFVVGAG